METESTYAFVYRSVAIRGETVSGWPGAVDMLSFRLEVDGVRIGNNEALKVGQPHYHEGGIEEPGDHQPPILLDRGVWAEPCGPFEDRMQAAEQVVRSIENELTTLMWRLDRENPNRENVDLDCLTIEANGPTFAG